MEDLAVSRCASYSSEKRDVPRDTARSLSDVTPCGGSSGASDAPASSYRSPAYPKTRFCRKPPAPVIKLRLP